MDTQGDSANFLDLWSSCGSWHWVQPGVAAKNWMVGQQAAQNDTVELVAVAAETYCLASASWLGSLVASQC